MVGKTAARGELPKTNLNLSLSHSFAFLTTPCPPRTLLYPYFSFPAEAEGTQAQGVCSQRGLEIMEGPAQTGEGSQTPAPACTAATG